MVVFIAKNGICYPVCFLLGLLKKCREGKPSIPLLVKTQLEYGILNLRHPRWCRDKESTCQCRRCRFDPWVGKIPWRRKWQTSPIFLPGESHGLRSLAGYSPHGHKSWTRLSGRTELNGMLDPRSAVQVQTDISASDRCTLLETAPLYQGRF